MAYREDTGGETIGTREELHSTASFMRDGNGHFEAKTASPGKKVLNYQITWLKKNHNFFPKLNKNKKKIVLGRSMVALFNDI